MKIPQKIRDNDATLRRRKALGIRIRVLREKAQMSQHAAALKLGRKQMVWWRWEVGLVSIPAELLPDILGVINAQMRHVKAALETV